MVNLFQNTLAFQLALCQGWMKFVNEQMSIQQNFWQHQYQIIQHPASLRFHDIIPSGASLLDHYGKRSHDVDVERV